MTKAEAWKNVAVEVENENPEAVLKALAEFFRLDADSEGHPTVKALLNGCAKYCDDAAFDYYASTK